MAERAIIHVDMDAFYAAVEQRDDPSLRGRPVIVGGIGRRGVVSTASYEARPFGVRSAMPTAEARRLCPDGVFLPPRMARYREVSAQVFAVFAEVTPEIEGLSLDEAFLDVGRSLRLLGDVETIGRRIKTAIRDRTGLACSVGMAHNKLLAKLASELGKPDGFLRIRPGEETAVLDPLPVGRLWTVGRVAAEKLARWDIVTIGDLRRAPLTLLERLLGTHGAALQRLARGDDDRPVVPDRADKSLGAETTFERDLETLDAARGWLMRLTERVAERARRHGLAGRTVTVKLRVPPFETMTRQATLREPSDATAAIHDAAEALLVRWWRERTSPRLRLLGVSLSGFTARPAASSDDLFAPAPPGPGASRDRVLDAINARFGGRAIRRATGLKANDDD